MLQITDMNYCGRALGSSPESVGLLRRSDDAVADREELWRRMESDGYLYLSGLLCREEVLDARGEILRRLAADGELDSGQPLMEGIARKSAPGEHNRDYHGPSRAPKAIDGMGRLTSDNPSLQKILYDGPMIDFYEFFLGDKVRHFDYTWFRVKPPESTSTTPHYDIVYMGRGTTQLFTSWVPFGKTPLDMGGLMILEGSHKLTDLRNTYGRTDVDRYCENEGDAKTIVDAAKEAGRPLEARVHQSIRWNSTGHYCQDAIDAREKLGGRWLSADYDLGDVVIFSMYTMHGSADNQSDRIRISSDSRYQLASEPVDERWIGDDPPAHGIRAKQGIIC